MEYGGPRSTRSRVVIRGVKFKTSRQAPGSSSPPKSPKASAQKDGEIIPTAVVQSELLQAPVMPQQPMERSEWSSDKPGAYKDVNGKMEEGDERKKMAKSEVQKCLEWLFEQQGDMETASYGLGKTGVLEALARQKAKVTTITDFQADIDAVLNSEKVEAKDAKELTGNYASVKALSDKRQSCLEVVQQIAGLEDLVQNLSCEFDARSLHLVNSASEHSGETGGPTQSNQSLARAAQTCIKSVRQNWRWLFQTMQCAEVHLRNAAAYQEFFHEVGEAEYWMNTTLSRIHLSFDRSKLLGSRGDAETMVKEIRDVLAAYLQWQTKVDFLFEKGQHVVPVPQRLRPIRDSIPVIALTDYTDNHITFIEGEALTLLDNSDPKRWQVKNDTGEVGYVPALVILIPSPSGEALDAAIRLRLQLLALWTSSIKRLGYQMIAFMQLVFRDWTEEEIRLLQAMTPEDREELLRILEVIETTLGEHWTGYGDFQELQERLTRLRMILEEESESNGLAITDNENNNWPNSVVVQIKSLEDLLRKYKDFWAFWETFKAVVEMLKNPRFLLVCDKWEQLRFVTSAHFVKFWDTQLDLVKEDLTMSTASLTLHPKPAEELVSSEVTIEEEKEETTTDTVTSDLTEEQHTFIIKGVLDPRDNRTKLTLQEAIMLGVVDQSNNTYNNPVTGEKMSMTDAMNEGRVIMDFVSKRKIREEKNSYGLITIKITKETRPYTITGVLDPHDESKLTVSQAAAKNILDTHSSTYKTETGELIPIADAISSGLVLVEYHDSHGETAHEPEVQVKTYAVHGVVDQKKKDKVSFAEAVRDGLLARDTGEYINNVTGQKVAVHEAIMKGFIKARIVADPSKLEVNPENTIFVEKMAHAKAKILKSVKAISAFKKMGLQAKH